MSWDLLKGGLEVIEKSLKSGLVIPLFKKGNRNNVNNYREVCLLAMGSRILARIMTSKAS